MSNYRKSNHQKAVKFVIYRDEFLDAFQHYNSLGITIQRNDRTALETPPVALEDRWLEATVAPRRKFPFTSTL